MARTPIQTALARHGGHIAIPVDFGPPRGVVEFRFSPGVGARMIAAVDEIQRLGESQAAQFRVMRDYLVDVCHQEDRADFASLVDSDAIDAFALAAIFSALREDAATVDPTLPSSSDAGSLATGPSSTVGAAPEGSTP